MGDEYGPPPPDMREVDGWVYSSQPVAVRPLDGGTAISLDRVRTIVVARRRAHDEPSRGPPRAAVPGRARGRGRGGRPRARRAQVDPADRGPRRQRRGAGDRAGQSMSDATLRVMWLYPDHMNIYADRGNIARARAPLRAGAGSGSSSAPPGPGERGRPRRARPLLHGRRPGPRPGAGRARPRRDASATRSPPRSTRGAVDARRSAAATSCSATPTSCRRRVAARASDWSTCARCASPASA